MQNVLVTGGAGFIGSNLVKRLLDQGFHVTVLDNLSRKGAELNMDWLHQDNSASGMLEFIRGDIRNSETVLRAAANADVIFHFAAQVAVTTSVVDPKTDFEINALGTINLLEAARLSGTNPIIIFTSTNKVYGEMGEIAVASNVTRYRYDDCAEGIPEERSLDFLSPYGCSKGAADQYVRDYSRIYGLRTVVFRMSCIYGPRQFGNEDQGWVAHFVIASLLGTPTFVYGDGKQVRDLLYIHDLIDGFLLAVEHIDQISGEVFNMGGGPENTLSILELLGQLTILNERPMSPAFADWRPGDQKIYISDIRKFTHMTDWKPIVGVEEGIKRLYNWVQNNSHFFP